MGSSHSQYYVSGIKTLRLTGTMAYTGIIRALPLSRLPSEDQQKQAAGSFCSRGPGPDRRLDGRPVQHTVARGGVHARREGAAWRVLARD